MAPTDPPDVSLNPYLPPSGPAEHAPALPIPKKRRHAGPAIPIVLGLLIGGLFGLPLLIAQNLVGFAFIFVGGTLGGIYYHWRAREWPVLPAARYKRFAFASIAAGIPVAVGALPTVQWGPKVLFAVVSLSVAMGILVSGDRRADD